MRVVARRALTVSVKCLQPRIEALGSFQQKECIFFNFSLLPGYANTKLESVNISSVIVLSSNISNQVGLLTREHKCRCMHINLIIKVKILCIRKYMQICAMHSLTKFSDLDEIKPSKTRKCILLLFEACCVRKPPFLQRTYKRGRRPRKNRDSVPQNQRWIKMSRQDYEVN